MAQSHLFPDCFYRVSIKGLFVSEGKIMLGRESETLSGKWELPGGGLDFGESPQVAVAREVEEEMGLHVTNVSIAPVYAWPVFFEKRRNRDWFYSMVLVYQIKVEDLTLTPSEECLEIKLFSPDELSGLDLHPQTVPLREYFRLEDFR